MKTLEQEIQELWKSRGMTVLTEKVVPLRDGKFRWIITAKKEVNKEDGKD